MNDLATCRNKPGRYHITTINNRRSSEHEDWTARRLMQFCNGIAHRFNGVVADNDLGDFTAKSPSHAHASTLQIFPEAKLWRRESFVIDQSHPLCAKISNPNERAITDNR